MQKHIQLIKIVIKKELKDHSKNSSIFIISIIPLLSALMYGNMDIPSEKLYVSLTFILSITIGMLTATIMAILIAEEKDKNTIETLLNTRLSLSEFLIGKAIVVFLYTNCLNAIAFLLLKAPFQFLFIYLVIGIVLSIIMLLIGLTVGLFSNNQIHVGIIISPITLSFMIVPLLSILGINIGKISFIFPTQHTSQLLYYAIDGYKINPINISVLTVWIIIALIVFYRVFKIKRFD